MIQSQVFKTASGASRRAIFETRQHGWRFRYHVVRFKDDARDVCSFDVTKMDRYTWRLERILTR